MILGDAHGESRHLLPQDASAESRPLGDSNSSRGKRTGMPHLSVTTVVITETVVSVMDVSSAGETSLSRSLKSMESVAATLTGTAALDTMAALTAASTSSMIATPASPSLAVDTPAPTSAVGIPSSPDASRLLVPSSPPGPVRSSVSTDHNFTSTTTFVSQFSTRTSSPVMSSSYNATATQDGPGDVPPSSPRATDGWNGAGAITGAGQPTQAAHAQPSGGSGSTLDGSAAKIVGGVVGGVAGLLLLVVAALMLVSRHKRFAQRTRGDSPAGQIDRGPLQESDALSAEMSYRRASHDPLFVAATIAPAFVKRWRQFNRTSTTDSTAESMTGERGFQKISGRKIPSVFRSGDDGYGGGLYEEFDTSGHPRSDLSSPPAVKSRLRATSPPPPSSAFGAPLDLSYTREDAESGAVVVRPSPARTPVASSVNVAPHQVTPLQAHTHSPATPKRPDTLGRSHPSFDGSRGSRFTESLDM